MRMIGQCCKSGSYFPCFIFIIYFSFSLFYQTIRVSTVQASQLECGKQAEIPADSPTGLSPVESARLKEAELLEKLRTGTGDIETRYALGELYLMKMGRFADALRILEPLKNTPRYSEDESYFMLLGRAYILTENYDRLYELCRDLVRKFPKNSYAHAGLGTALAIRAARAGGIFKKLSLANRALDELGIALELDPANHLARFTRGLIFYEMPSFLSKLDDSVRDLEILVACRERENEFLLDGYYYLVRGLMRQKREKEALVRLQEALNLFPGNEALERLKRELERGK